MVDIEKKVDKIFETFLKIPPPPEKILDPPLILRINALKKKQNSYISA